MTPYDYAARLSEIAKAYGPASLGVQRLIQSASDAHAMLKQALSDADNADEAADRNKARALVLSTLKAIKDFEEAARDLAKAESQASLGIGGLRR